MDTRRQEADEFYAPHTQHLPDDDSRNVLRQAYAGMIWGCQYYNYDVARWLEGDPTQPPPPEARKTGRNCGWKNIENADVLSMPDSWEYPWYAAWGHHLPGSCLCIH